MNSKRMQVAIAALLIGVLMIGFAGCKDDSAAEAPESPADKIGEVAGGAASTVSQTTCPVMGKPINESIYTEYKGQKVYFCCPPCVDKFKADPEKYVKDLPQFKE